MNPAAVHLALNNFPPVTDLAALIVLAIGVIWNTPAVVRTGLALLVVAALIAIPVYLTGEPAEHVVEGLEGVNARAIHPHEEAAEWAFVLLEVQGALSLLMLLFYRARPIANWALAAILIIAVVATIAVFRTATLGGRIHHPEVEMAP